MGAMGAGLAADPSPEGMTICVGGGGGGGGGGAGGGGTAGFWGKARGIGTGAAGAARCVLKLVVGGAGAGRLGLVLFWCSIAFVN